MKCAVIVVVFGSLAASAFAFDSCVPTVHFEIVMLCVMYFNSNSGSPGANKVKIKHAKEAF